MKLYKGNIVFTKVPDHFEIIERANILVDQGTILEVGKNIKVEGDMEVVDYGDSLLIPAFVDLHFHAVQFGNLGIGLDEELLDWLNHYTFKEEEKFQDLAYAKKIFTSALDTLVENGTTRVVFFSSIHYEATKLLMELCQKKGVGAYVGKVNMDRNSIDALNENTQTSFEITKKLLDLGDDKVKSIITPRFAPACSPELLDLLGGLASDNRVQTHISETRDEIKWVETLFPERENYLDVYDHFNLIGDKTILAHCVFCSGEEKEKIYKKGCTVAHCPSANFNLTSGIMDVKDYLDRGIKVGLGTDIGAGNDMSIKDVLVDALKMSKVNHMMDSTKKILSFSEAFYMATKGGGQYFGRVGSFEPGYDLDMLVVKKDDLADLRGLTLIEQLQKFIYTGTSDKILFRYCQGLKLQE